MAWYRCTEGSGGGGGGSGAITFGFQADVSTGWSDTSGSGSERNMLTITAADDTTVSFGSSASGRTNCGSNHGYIAIYKNGTEQKKVTLTTNTDVNLGAISDVSLSAGDVLTVTFGFQGSHTNINMHMYNGEITIDGNVSITGASSLTNSTVTIL